MARSSSEEPTKTKTDGPDYGVVRGATRYDPAEWEAFEKFCEKNGLAPGTYIKKMIRDVIAGRMVALGGVKPEALAELKKFADEMGLELPTAVERIVTDFLVARRRERAAAKR